MLRSTPLLGLLAFLAACTPQAPRGPQRLLLGRTLSGAMPRSAVLSAGGETRQALLESSRWRIALPRRALLTFALGVSWTGAGEAPGWYRVALRSGGRVLAERTLNPRAAHGWREVSVPLDGLPRSVDLEFELRFTDRDARPLPLPPGLLTGVADPVVHDLDDYGRAPGIVLVSIDTLRRDHVGAYGYPRPTTPRIDALAREGLFCEDAVSAASWTLPAHLSMLTSVDPGAHGGTDTNHGYNGRAPSLATVLKGAGWATQAVTSHLYVSSVYGLDRGFDHLDFLQDRPANDVAGRAIALLDRLGDRPFFLFLHFYDPHWHYAPPESTRRLFAKPYSGTLTGLWQDFSKRDRSNTTPEDLEHLQALYDGEIRYVDDELGRVLDHIEARGLDRGTLLAVTSDHGEEFLEHGSWEHQKTLYEEVVRVPLLFHGPRVPARRERGQTSLLDVAPTLLRWAGVPPPPGQQGRSLLEPPGERDGYGETDHTTDGTKKLFLRGGAERWKAILSLAADGNSVAREEWYDLASDPREAKSSVPSRSVADAIRARALERWRQARGRGGPAPGVRLTPEQRERLKALGYVGP